MSYARLLFGIAIFFSLPGFALNKPLPRPEGLTTPQEVLVSPRARPDNLKLAMSQRIKKSKQAKSTGAAGKLCGISGAVGTSAGTVSGPKAGCGITNPVRVTAVQGMSLTNAAVVDCTTVKALNRWVQKSLSKEFKRQGGVSKIHVAASYSCRTRNNRPGAKMSEHSLGHAIDISGFTLADGSKVTVLKDWKSRTHGKTMQTLHKKACGIFGTVLGPNSDRYHQDHFHFDTARYRSGAYCR